MWDRIKNSGVDWHQKTVNMHFPGDGATWHFLGFGMVDNILQWFVWLQVNVSNQIVTLCLQSSACVESHLPHFLCYLS